MDAATRETVLRRLAYIEGHLGGVRRMIEADQNCLVVLQQTYAVRRAIKQMESKLVAGHLRHCVMEDAEQSADKRLEEVVEVCSLAFRRPRSR